MNTRKDLRTSESDFRATDHRRKQIASAAPAGRVTWPIGLALLLVSLAAGIGAAKAQVNGELEANMVMSDIGWHAVAGGAQVQAHSIDAVALPVVAIWQRVPVGSRYGQWLHTKTLIHCGDRAQVLYAVLDSGRIHTIRELTGNYGVAESPAPGSRAYQTMQAVCGLYGYQL